MSTARNRLRIFPTSVGTRSTSGGSTDTSSRLNGSERCVDVIGNKEGNNGLTITRTRLKGGLLNGERNLGGGNITTWNNFPVEAEVSAAGTIDYAMSQETAAYRGYNLSNPSRHNVLLPAFLLELRDLPKMLRFAGRILSNSEVPRELILRSLAVASGRRGNQHRRSLSRSEVALLVSRHLTFEQQDIGSVPEALAAANLAYQFGWRPLISDISTMVGFTQAVEQRRKEINRLYSGRGLKRKITLQKDSNFRQQYVVVDSVLGNVAAECSYYSNTNIWTVARWKPNNPSALPPADWQIAQTFLGLDVHGLAASAWEVLKWSWLIDYFTNLGDFLDLSSNSFDASATISVCYNTSLRVTFPTTSVDFGPGGSKTVSAFEKVVETKVRKAGLPNLTGIFAKVPNIGANQLSILGSLSILKFLGK